MIDPAQQAAQLALTDPDASVAFTGAPSNVDSARLWKGFASFRLSPLPYTVVSGLLAALWFLPVPFSHYTGSDGFFAHVNAIASYDGVSRANVYAQIASYYAHMHYGWFPVASVPLGLWLYGGALAKATHYVLIILSFVLFSVIARKLFGSSSAAVAAVAAALFVWQFRIPFDPVAGTSLVIPWSACLVLGSWAAWFTFIGRQKPAWLVVACVLVVAASWTSPAAAALCVALAVTTFTSRNRIAFAAVWLAVIAAIAVSSLLRATPTPWASNIHYAPDVLAQIVAPLPTSFRAFGNLPIGHIPSLYHNGTHYIDDRFIAIPPPTIFDWMGILAMTLATALSLTSRNVLRAPRSRNVQILIFSCAFWIVPAILLWPPEFYRHALPLGDAFEGVYFQYFGVALLIVFGLLRIYRFAPSALRIVPVIGALAVFLVAYGNVRADNVVLAKAQRLDRARDLIARAARAGFFKSLPDYSTIAIDSTLPFAVGIHRSVNDAKYALYEYTGKRFRIVDATHLANGSGDNAWVLRAAARGNGILLSLDHWAGSDERGNLTDHSYGFVVDSSLAASIPWQRRGVRTTTVRLMGAALVEATRTCAPVPLKDAFAADSPTIEWRAGFYQKGPVGYQATLPERDALGDIATYPKMFMSGVGSIALRPTECPSTFENFQAVAVAAAPATLRISYGNHVDRIRVSSKPTEFWLRIPSKRMKRIRILFETNAPESSGLDPIDFRYEHDRPRGLRLIIEPTDVWEDVSKIYNVQTVASPNP